MKIFDSITKEKIEIKNSNNVKMYVCGPTVYDDVHIGNIRPTIIFDILYKYLILEGFNIKYISNITDIDDKIVYRSIYENKNELELSKFYFELYLDILKKINIYSPPKFIKVSDNINIIIKYIQKLLEKNFAYKIEGDGIYFNTNKISNYGATFGNEIINNIIGEKNKDNNKINKNDFALWKNKAEGITWDSPFGKGRPGWHTECAAIIDNFFEKETCIHGGGIDLKFPHHENENAQSNALNGINISKIWMHVGHLTIDNLKMSKSLNNFIKVKDLLSKYNSNDIRWMFFQTSYSKPFNFNYGILDDAKNYIEKLELKINNAKSHLIINGEFLENKICFCKDDIDALGDNLNIPLVLTSISNNVKLFSTLIKNNEWKKLNDTLNKVFNILDLLGIKFIDLYDKNNLYLLKDWKKKYDNKDYDESDKLRVVLINKKLLF
ncbi:MAG: cysteine--tRNA ligase [Mycoplasmoidaceae bacterium]